MDFWRKIQVPRTTVSYLGLAFGLIGYFIALSPSLMPRPPFFMGVVAGVGFATWYCIGVLVSHVIRHSRRVAEPRKHIKRRAWLALAGVTPLFIIATTMLARYWHNDHRGLIEQAPLSDLHALTIVSIAAVTFMLLLLIQRGLRLVFRAVRRWIVKLGFLPSYVGAVAAAVIATLIVIGTLTGVLERTVVVSIDAAYSADNNYIDPAFPQPTSELRSGSDASSAAWKDLGREGRRFVSSGPNADAIAAFTGQPAKEPIRVFAGSNNADGRPAQVELAMEELERTGAFERKMLMVAVPTGSGWIEAETVAAFEYMHGGDTAIVTAQYSYLPSGLALTLDQGDATAMGKELLHAVENKLNTLPKETRPKLILYGLSLGSYGGQADFTGESDFAARLDGALFVGTPGFSEPWRTLTRERDAGSPQVDPVYRDARVIKFASSSDDVINDIDPQYKIVYFQYATDPFVWFDGRLLYAQPDWMREAPGRAVSSHLRWFPVITFTQLAVDMMFSFISGDNGHDYKYDTVPALAAATRPSDWTADKSRALQSLIVSSDRTKDRE